MISELFGRQTFLLLTLICSISPTAIAQSALPQSLQDAVDNAIGEQMERQHAVGVAIGIIQDGKVVYVKGYGFQDREQKIPMSTTSMVRWASVSKTITAIAAMQMVEQGKLMLSDDVRKYVPEFPDKRDVVTVRDLLCHQGGIVHYANGPVVRTKADYKSEHPFENVIAALDTFRESPLVNHPGEKYSYSTHAYILLSAVVERAGEQPFADQVRQRITEPLKLKSLQPDYQWRSIPDRAVGYRLFLGQVIRSADTDVSWKLGGGGYISNVQDMATYARAIAQGQLLSRQSWRMVSKVQTTSDGKPTECGLGFFVDGSGDMLQLSHNGSQEKARTRVVTWPNKRNGIVVMSNSENVNPGDLTTAVSVALNAIR